MKTINPSDATRSQRKRDQRARETPAQKKARRAKTRKYKRAWYAKRVTAEVTRRRVVRQQARVVEVGPQGGLRKARPETGRVIEVFRGRPVRVLDAEGRPVCPDCQRRWETAEGWWGRGRCPDCAAVWREVNRVHAWALNYVRGCADCGTMLPIPAAGGRWQQRCAGCQAVRVLRQRWDWNLRKHYGITLVQYEELLAAQGGVCAICGKAPESRQTHRLLYVDHDHQTGTVRGLLCRQCNFNLGHVENVTWLAAAQAYLQKFTG